MTGDVIRTCVLERGNVLAMESERCTSTLLAACCGCVSTAVTQTETYVTHGNISRSFGGRSARSHLFCIEISK